MSEDKLRSIIKEHLSALTTESKADGYKDPAYRATVKQFKGKKATKEEFAQALAMHHKSMDESVNEGKFAGWIAGYNGKQIEIKKGEAKDLYSAKLLAIKKLKVPKSKVGLMFIKPAVDESVNEISTKNGLADVIKGRTSAIEGIKISKDLAQAISRWINTSPYGRKYGKHILKGRIHSLIGPANAFGIERGFDSKTKQEWKALYAKHGPKKEAVIEQLKELQSIGEHHDDPDFPGKDLSAWDLLDKLKSGNIDLYNKVEDFMKTMNEEEGVPHYTKDGKEWSGPMHKMPDGTLMTQNPHNDDSEELFHKEDLTEAKTQFAVEYRDAKGKPKKKDEPIIKRFNSKSQAEAFAKKGNKVDAVGGTYKVVEVPVVESVNEISKEEKAAQFKLKLFLQKGLRLSVKDGEDKLYKYAMELDRLADDEYDNVVDPLFAAVELVQDAGEPGKNNVVKDKEYYSYIKSADKHIKTFVKNAKKAIGSMKESVNEAEDYKYKKYVTKAFNKISDAMFEFRNAMGVKQLGQANPKLKKRLELMQAEIFALRRDMKSGGLTESKLNEMDINDPILIAVRARKQMLAKAKAAPKTKKISTKQYYQLMDAEIDLINSMKDAAKDYERLDSEMNQEAGQKGKDWTDADANRYGGKLDKLQTKIEKLAKQKQTVKKSIMKYRMN